MPTATEDNASLGLALELVLPGVTVPWAHALYIWTASALSLAVHEVCCRGLLACMHTSCVLRQNKFLVIVACVSSQWKSSTYLDVLQVA